MKLSFDEMRAELARQNGCTPAVMYGGVMAWPDDWERLREVADQIAGTVTPRPTMEGEESDPAAFSKDFSVSVRAESMAATSTLHIRMRDMPAEIIRCAERLLSLAGADEEIRVSWRVERVKHD